MSKPVQTLKTALFTAALLAGMGVAPVQAAQDQTAVHFNKSANWKKIAVDRVAIMPVESTFGLDPATAFDIQEAVNDVLQEWEVFTLPVTREEAVEKDEPFSFASVNRVAHRFEKTCHSSRAPFTLQVVATQFRTETGRFSFTKGKSVVGLDFALCQKGNKQLIYRATVTREAGKEATLKPGTGRKSRGLALVNAITAGLGPLFRK